MAASWSTTASQPLPAPRTHALTASRASSPACDQPPDPSKGGQRRARERDARLAGAADELLERGDQPGAGGRVHHADVVDRVVGEDHPARSGPAEHVAAEAVEGALPGAVGERLVAADALVEHPDRTAAVRQPPCQVVRPAPVVVLRRGHPVRDRRAERDHRARGRGVPHVQVAEERATAVRGGVVEAAGGADVAARPGPPAASMRPLVASVTTSPAPRPVSPHFATVESTPTSAPYRDPAKTVHPRSHQPAEVPSWHGSSSLSPACWKSPGRSA
ncbi:hypothetical protein SAMN05216223_113132 [Actinacidiphila yanglinensis]|uniref:Uncharacterized protein n=1 Tax=Actinacidiphila yanglinensis TaxID=310779 RepID=A0A1H6DD11_9ACTN|nr:hypothetical protein SAMN05216223_113132 [Actinacidiphila yanglinensis]